MRCVACQTELPDNTDPCPSCGESATIELKTVSLEKPPVQDWSQRTINDPAQHTATLEPGTVLGERYEIIEKLGEGGMGAVLKARDREVDRLVALKVIRSDLAGRADVLRRFRQELVLARQVTHRNVVRIYDLSIAGGVRFITMEFIDGRELAAILKDRGKFPPRQAAQIMLQVFRGLTAAHAEGVVHRDLKPANIMIAHEGRVAVMDFGIAHSTAAATEAVTLEQASEAILHPNLTKAGSLLGTPRYMSPEQANREPADHRSDLFSAGLIFYELLTGAPPNLDKNLNRALKDRASVQIAPPAQANPDIPDRLNRVVARCLALDPKRRYQSADRVVQDLEIFLGIRGRKWTRGQKLSVVACVAAIVTGSVYSYLAMHPGPAPPKPAVKVVVADFDNFSGDPRFNGTLEPMMNAALEGASFITAFDRGQAHKIAGQLSGNLTLDEKAARLVAAREGIGVVIGGGVGRAGSGYEVTARAVDAGNGKVIAKRSADASNAKDLAKSVASVAAGIRKALGDATSEGAQVAAAETFSSKSLEASQSYALAQELQWKGKWSDAIAAYQKAIALDPDFGRAYAGLAATLANQGWRQDAEKMYRLAMSKIDRMSDREKYRTRGGYYLLERDYNKAIEQFRALSNQYPADTAGSAGLALAYFYQRNFPAALEEGRRSLVIYPDNLLNLNNVGLYAMYAGEFDTAIAESRKLIGLNSSFEKAYVCLGLSLLAEGKVEEATQAYRKLSPAEAAAALADLALYEGRLKDALDASAPNSLLSGEILVRQKNTLKALAVADKASAAGELESVLYPAAIIYIEAGNERKALALANRLASRLEPEPQAYGKLIEAEAKLHHGEAREAVKDFQAAQALADTWLGRLGLGRAYLALKAFTEADTEFDTCLRRRGEATSVFLDDEPTYHYLPRVFYYLGLAQEGLGSAGAAQSFQTFLSTQPKGVSDSMVADAKRHLESLGGAGRNANPR